MNILYWVQSDGMGHALRSYAVIQYLLSQGHTVKVVTSGRAREFFQKHSIDVEEVEWLSFYYHNNKVSYIMTGIKNLFHSPRVIQKCIVPLTKIILQFKPDVIITDFEVFTAKAWLLMDIPVISIDNISLLFLAKLPYSLSTLTEYIIARFTAQGFIHGAYHYCVTSFFEANLLHAGRDAKKVSFVPPILRKEIIDVEPYSWEHTIVYQSTHTNKKLIPALHWCPDEQFIYYGCEVEKQDKNICYKKFSTQEFIADLASAKAVITNGGFTLISEAIYLHKPILCNPIEKHYEQFLNSEMVTKLGYGKTTNDISAKEVRTFFNELSAYQKNLSQYQQEGNKKLFDQLDVLLQKIMW
jgi:uncharacterized protein (TIGR00661 family)